LSLELGMWFRLKIGLKWANGENVNRNQGEGGEATDCNLETQIKGPPLRKKAAAVGTRQTT
jgi:hypothetical protein